MPPEVVLLIPHQDQVHGKVIAVAVLVGIPHEGALGVSREVAFLLAQGWSNFLQAE